MSNFHLSNSEVMPCNAQPGNCPIGGQHYATMKEAQKAFEKRNMDKTLTSMTRKDKVKIDLNTSEFTAALNASPVYQKEATVEIRVAQPGEKLETVLSDGSVETSRVLDGGEIIVRNPTGEEYAVSKEKFDSRYELREGVWHAKGEIHAVRNSTGSSVVIDAPWGEEQSGDANCYFASSVEAPDDRYIIGADEFAKTYIAKGAEGSSFYGTAKPMKGGSYQGVEVSPMQIQNFRDELKNVLGDEKFSEYSNAKNMRDGGEVYHVTVISPQEKRSLAKNNVSVPPLQNAKIQPVGLGSVSKDEDQTWYVVCQSPEIQNWRSSLNLPSIDLHVTLAFNGKDVHGLSKGPETLL